MQNKKEEKGRKDSPRDVSIQIFDNESLRGGSENSDSSREGPDEPALAGTLSSAVAWNENILILLKRLGNKAMGYRWMHEQESLEMLNKDSKFSKIEIILLALIGAVTSGEFITFLVEADLYEHKVVAICVLSLHILMLVGYGILKSMRESGNYPKESFEHKYSSIRFGELGLDIQNQLSLNVEDRDTDKVFLRNTIKTYNDLMLISPKVDPDTMDKYVNAIEDNDIYTPLIIDVAKDVSSTTVETDVSSAKNLDHEIKRWLHNC